MLLRLRGDARGTDGSRPAALNKLTELDPATIHTNESGVKDVLAKALVDTRVSQYRGASAVFGIIRIFIIFGINTHNIIPSGRSVRRWGG